MPENLQVEAFTSAGFLHRKGLQYHWRNRDRNGKINNSNNDVVNGADAAGVVGGVESVALLEGGEGGEGTKKKYDNFDGYLGNFASKRRIKVRLLFLYLYGARSVLIHLETSRPRRGELRNLMDPCSQ